MRTLLTWIRSGVVASVLIAPPCETWSAARWNEVEEGPRPLRNAQDPICLAQLSLAEVQQLEVSSYLLYVSIRVILACMVAGVPGTLEHPKEPRGRHLPSIWRLPWLQAMLHSPLLQRWLLWQAAYGSPAAKPTHFACCHQRSFRSICKGYEEPIQWKDLIVLEGKDLQGHWRTAMAKEYPSRLNLALAASHVHAMQDRSYASNIDSALKASVEEEYSRLFTGSDFQFNPDQAIQPDYHRQSGRLDTMD
eukprot:Skav220564  [mRNA]  locus=scaffold2140:17435:18181:+ [translate_table: standard]